MTYTNTFCIANRRSRPFTVWLCSTMHDTVPGHDKKAAVPRWAGQYPWIAIDSSNPTVSPCTNGTIYLPLRANG
jgi:hypothetical protein